LFSGFLYKHVVMRCSHQDRLEQSLLSGYLEDFLLDDFFAADLPREDFFAGDLLPEDFFAADLFPGTLLPLFLASDKPMAIACLRLVTFFPLRPLLRVPAFFSFMARSTFLPAPAEYLAIEFLFMDSKLMPFADANEILGKVTGISD